MESLAAKSRRSRAPAILGAAFAVLVAAVVWFTLFRSDPPQFQQQVDMPGMGRHRVNLWTKPVRDGSGRTVLVGQVADPADMAVRVSSMEFEINMAAGTRSLSLPGTYSPASFGQSHVFSATAVANLSGYERVAVRFNMAGLEGQAMFVLGTAP